jgi:putative transcriptional regulator
VQGINDMNRHLAGNRVRGVRTTHVDATDIQSIRKTANLSQPRFAKLIGVNLRTLQNWEQGRTRPTGPARALLKIVASNPKSANEALHA